MKRADPNHTILFDTDSEPAAVLGLPVKEFDFADRPDIALLYRASGALMDLLGPMFWAALIVLFIQAALFAA